jgi:hypothetical protein
MDYDEGEGRLRRPNFAWHLTYRALYGFFTGAAAPTRNRFRPRQERGR